MASEAMELNWEVETPKDVGLEVSAALVQAGALVGAPAARAEFNVDGSGLCAAVLDTGINVAHNDFGGRIVAQRNFTDSHGGDSSNGDDDNGHGSNVAGIIAANGVHVGMAPGANLVSLKVLNKRGSGGSSQEALEWVLKHHEEHNITVVCMSLGVPNTALQTDEMSWAAGFRAVLQKLEEKRVVVCIAAGNDYFTVRSKEGHSWPGICREAVTVGAVYDSNIGPIAFRSGAKSTSTAADQLTCFTQRLSPEVGHPDCFTDVFAPGAPITSSGISGPFSSSRQSGTSQATPLVAGAVLLLQQLYKRRFGELPTVQQVKHFLHFGVLIFDGDDERANNTTATNKWFTRVDFRRALEHVPRPRPEALTETGVVGQLNAGSDLYHIETAEGKFMCFERPTGMQVAQAIAELDLSAHVGQTVTIAYTQKAGGALWGAHLVE